MPKFQGFTPDSFAFLKELKLNNSKRWMDANKSRYEDLKNRVKALIEDVADKYISSKYPALELEALEQPALLWLELNQIFLRQFCS